MEPENCFICNATSVFYSRNLYKTKSKYSETRICEFIRRFLGNYPTERDCSNDNEYCVCIECLRKIDEYDLASMTAKRMERELSDVLLQTEALFYRECKSEAFGPPIETVDTLDDYRVECYEGNGDIETIEQRSDSESYRVESQSDEDYIPPVSMKSTSKNPSQRLAAKIQKSRVKTTLPNMQNRNHKCHKCNVEFKRFVSMFDFQRNFICANNDAFLSLVSVWLH